MNAQQKAENKAIRVAVAEAAKRELKKRPFNLFGRGHESRVTLDRRLATILRGQDIPRIYISGYGANYRYPRRVLEAAAELIEAQLGVSLIAFVGDTAYRTGD
jgi:hypothetical protein